MQGDEMKFWKDLAGTIPCESGDKVAAMTSEKHAPFYQPDPNKRPTLTFQGALANTKPMGDNWRKK